MPIRKDLRPLYRTPAWFAARKAVRERAKDCCERCGAENGSWVVRENGRSVEVTEKDAAAAKVRGLRAVKIQCGCCHRVPVPLGDHNLGNLLWMCRGCHLRFDRGLGVHRATRETRKDRARPLLAEACA